MLIVVAYCIYIGRLVARYNRSHWAAFFFYPVVFTVVALAGLLSSGLYSLQFYLFLSMSTLAGALVGFVLTHSIPIKINVAQRYMTTPGSWFLLVNLILLCVSKYTIVFLSTISPEQAFNFQAAGWLLKCFVTGTLYGRALNFAYRFWVATGYPVSTLRWSRSAFLVGLTKISYEHYMDLRKSK